MWTTGRNKITETDSDFIYLLISRIIIEFKITTSSTREKNDRNKNFGGDSENEKLHIRIQKVPNGITRTGKKIAEIKN